MVFLLLVSVCFNTLTSYSLSLLHQEVHKSPKVTHYHVTNAAKLQAKCLEVLKTNHPVRVVVEQVKSKFHKLRLALEHKFLAKFLNEGPVRYCVFEQIQLKHHFICNRFRVLH